jgi:aminoglycoside phosphotransferase (APT) family kinase protein
VAEIDRRAEAAGPTTLCHGDASSANMRTSATGEIALLDWEDYGTGPGVCDLAWHLVSSVEPADWDRALDAYGDASGLEEALRSACVQGLLSFAFEDPGDDRAVAWVSRLEEAARRLRASAP